MFAHYSEILAKGFRNLAEGQRVSYRVTEARLGPQARGITPLPGDTASAPPAAGDTDLHGSITWFNPRKGHGFITPDLPGPDIFLPSSEIADDRWTPEPGQRVTFHTQKNKKGLTATKVRKL
ncbi:hypothetical protein GCM10022221_75010 [Actinocorallia aurea]